MSFHNKTVLVTGAAQGIGRNIAACFLERGAFVFLNDVNSNKVNRAAEEMKQGEGQVRAVSGDISDEKFVAELMQHVTAETGGIDILVNNAGISPRHNGKKTEVEDMTLEEWEQVMAVNLRSQFLTSRAVIPAMKQKRWGRIINMSSQAAKIRPAEICGADYIASKSGVLGLTRALAVELGSYGITVNSVCPGLTESEMLSDVKNQDQTADYQEQIPVNRLGAPEDVANAVLYLADPASNFINGTSLDVNGGYHMN
ncbi:SDR family NAD(P)-dependent oxidoreductase [Salibacterium sp. K-3]